ncbi:MAG: 2-amino-4-hydroxy-6-hydroxymethyldihydropteridine diphosphokinase [Acidobacteriota bacterium]
MTNSAHSNEAEIAIYLGLGSNVGDREANLREAKARIEKLGIEIARESSIYETEPVGFTDQRWFLNQVIEVKLFAGLTSECGPITGDPEVTATIGAGALLSELLNIERAMGRERTVANGPRPIDIDLLLFGALTVAHSKDDEEWPYIDSTDIFVPHPRMHERRFVLEPLCEIAPDLVHPTLKKTCRELLESLQDTSSVRLYTKD